MFLNEWDMWTKKSVYAKTVLVGLTCLGLIISFQNCGQTQRIYYPNLTGLTPGTQCYAHSVEMDADSLCIKINQFDQKMCWQGSNYTYGLDFEGQLKMILNHFYICQFENTGSISQVQSFTVNNNNSFFSTPVSLSQVIDIPFQVSINEATIDSVTNIPRLLSFASVQPIQEGNYCLNTNTSLHRVNLDEDDGNILLSNDPQISCGVLDGNTLNCVYQAKADRQGCIFRLTLWSYDSDYRIAPSGADIQIQMTIPIQQQRNPF